MKEKIKELCVGIIDVTPNKWDNPNGPVESTCPFCLELMTGSGYNYPTMSDITHDASCVYIKAKEMLRSIENENNEGV